MQTTTVNASIEIAAPPDEVWRVLTDRTLGRIWRSADYDTDWTEGAVISISAYIGSKTYKDKGRVLQRIRPNLLSYEFWARASGLPDAPESYSIVTLRLSRSGTGTWLVVEHTVPPSPVRRGKGWEIGPESGEKHVAFYWRGTLTLLRDIVEGRESLALKLAKGALPDSTR